MMPISLSTVQPATWIALFGWMVTAAGWMVSQTAQRRLFVHQVKNGARSELISALRTEQGILGRLNGSILTLDIDRQNGRTDNQPQEKWNEAFERYHRIAERIDTQWIFQLEQYEVLFPETARCRKDLGDLARRAHTDVTSFFVGLLYPQDRGAVLLKAPDLMNRLSNLEALIEDVLVHVQNATLGVVVGRKVPFRQPTDSTVPRIVLRKGILTIVDGQGVEQSHASESFEMSAERGA